ncbi:MAG: YgiQ family radical SAM protein [Oleiphilus sp.]|nr:MAG: YgiQ family radical SAM protein [Oleiphilus sp.]
MQVETPLFSYPKYWAECYGTAPFLPMSREEMDQLGWDSCDVIIVCGDAYVDHPSFGMAVIGRLLESQGFRVGIIAQPNWTSKDAFQALGKPNLFFAVSAGNMDSMINRYTSDLKIRHDDAYTPGNVGGKRPDRAVTVYSQRCREAFKDVPVIIGGIEASLRRMAHYDYWSDKVKRSVLLDSKADLLLYGNAERAIAEVAHRIARGEHPKEMHNIRGTAIVLNALPEDWNEKDSTRLDRPGRIEPHTNPYVDTRTESPGAPCSTSGPAQETISETQVVKILPVKGRPKQYIRLPSFEKVSKDPVLYAHASRVLHLETNPANAQVLVQPHGDRHVWINPPPIPLSTEELDSVFEKNYQRVPHPAYGDAKIPAYEMIRFSVNIMRGCFGGCSFCSITEHEGRVIQSRSEESIIKEIETIRDKTPGFTGTISDLGGPTANMYQLNCKSEEIHARCKRLSCVYPGICKSLETDHSPTTQLYRRARALPGIKRIFVASGLRYDLAVEDPEYVKELVTHHVGGYLKIAPEHTEGGPLSKMMKPGMDTYYRFKEMFEKFSEQAGKKQYLIPYFIAAHPGTRDEDMLNLALWLKQNGFRADQVQNFYPSPMASATAMYHSEKDPLHRIDYKSSEVPIPKGIRQRRLHKAFLRYHDPDNWPLLRDALKAMGKAHLIGYGKKHLIPPTQPKKPSRNVKKSSATSKMRKGRFHTQHTGLPPRKQS